MRKSTAKTIAMLLGGGLTLAASNANAQIFSPCLVFGSPLPPPCLILDPSAIAQDATKLASMVSKLQNLTQIGENLATMGKIYGQTAASGNGVASWNPINPSQEVSYAAAATTLQQVFPTSSGLTQAQTDAYIANLVIAKRAAAGDGWATAMAMKFIVEGMVTDGQTVANTIGNCDLSLRDDWQMNTLAKQLYLRANTGLREIRAAALLAKSINAAAMAPATNLPASQYTDAPLAAAPASTQWNGILSQIQQATTQLQALQNAQSAGTAFTQASSLLAQEQASLAGLQQAVSTTTSAVQNIAAQIARQNGVTPDQVMTIIQQDMATDTSTWSDPNKAAFEQAAAQNAIDDIEGLTGNHPGGDLLQAIVNMDEAEKQISFMSPLLTANANNTQNLATAQNEFSTAVGVDVTDQAAVNSQISALQSQIQGLMSQLSGAPPSVQLQAQNIYGQIQSAAAGTASATTPTTTPSTNANVPPLSSIRINNHQ